MATFDPRKDKWRAQVRKTGYKPQTRTFPTLAQAKAWARGIEADMDRGIAPDVGRLRATSVRDIFERFRDEVCPTRKGGDWEVVRLNFILRESDVAHCRLDQDIAAVLRSWAARRLKEVSAASVNRELNLISGVFSHAIKEWGVPLRANPVHQVKRPKGTGKHRDRTWSADDLAKFKAALPETNLAFGRVIDYVLPALELGIETAMRLSEICSIRVADVHLDERWLHLGDTKNGDARDVPLSQRAVEIVRPLLATATASDSEHLVPVSAASLGVEFREVRNRAGLQGLRFHDARHTAATNLSKKLPNVLELAAVTGHRSLQSLKRYYNPKASDLAAKLG